jgi:acyl-CoA synthetase (AMP-forming)/AMP-acid ligase II
VQFSSGTTGDPRPVALSRAALVAQARLLNAQWPETPGFVPSGVCWLPLHHDMGLVGCLLPALERPADLTLLPPDAFVARPALWLRALSRSRASVSPAPSFAYALCLRRVRDAELDGVDLSAWRHALCGAEPVAPDVLRRFADRFAPWGLRREALTPVYGLAEAGLAVTFAPLDRPFTSARFGRETLLGGLAIEEPGGRELASLGRPLPGVRVEVRGEGGTPLPERRVGEVWVSSPSLMSGYLGRPAETAAVLRDGWLATGDLGFLRGGDLFLVGRAKDVVIVRGRNHAAEEIEAAAGAVAGLRPGGVAALGWLPESGEEEELLLLVEREPGGNGKGQPGAAEALAAACREAVLGALGLRAGRVAVLDAGALPRTSSGKLRRREALRRWLAGELVEVAPTTLEGSPAAARGRA